MHTYLFFFYILQCRIHVKNYIMYIVCGNWVIIGIQVDLPNQIIMLMKIQHIRLKFFLNPVNSILYILHYLRRGIHSGKIWWMVGSHDTVNKQRVCFELKYLMQWIHINFDSIDLRNLSLFIKVRFGIWVRICIPFLFKKASI